MDHTGAECSSGTGFFYRVALGNGQEVPIIVTNKHVIANKAFMKFRVSTIPKDADPDTAVDVRSVNTIEIQIALHDSLVIPHSDAAVDLCAVRCATEIHPLLLGARRLHVAFLSRDLHLTENEASLLRHVETVAMTGYPIGLYDNVNDAPIVRIGSTATHALLPFQGRPEFVIDMQCLPGSSGSPVFLFQDGLFRSSKSASSPGTQIALLGVLHAGPTWNVDGTLQPRPLPTSINLVPVTQVPTGLGFVIRAAEIDVLASEIRHAGH
jgi:hypothetical protein